MKLKTNTSLLVLYVCSWPGLEDRSSGPGIIVSRSLSRGEFASLSSKHGFFLARVEKSQKKKNNNNNVQKKKGIQKLYTKKSEQNFLFFSPFFLPHYFYHPKTHAKKKRKTLRFVVHRRKRYTPRGGGGIGGVLRRWRTTGATGVKPRNRRRS